MQKTITGFASVLLLMSSASASAQSSSSSVQLYGFIDLGITSRQLSGDTGRTTLQSGGAMTTPFFGFRGSEDLGGGYAASFTIESFFRADTGQAGRSDTDPFFARTASVSLVTPVGTLGLGRQVTPSFLLGVRANPFGSASGVGPYQLHTYMPSVTQPMATLHGAGDSAWSNSIGFTSRNLSGLTLSALAALREGSTSAGSRYGVSGTYVQGPFLGGIAYERIDHMRTPWGAPAPLFATAARPTITATDMNALQAGFTYDMGVAKFHAQRLQGEIMDIGASKTTLTTHQLGVTIPVGTSSVLASVAQTRMRQPSAAPMTRTTFSAGYDHRLSRRTDIYLIGMYDKVTALSSGTTLSAGIRHAF